MLLQAPTPTHPCPQPPPTPPPTRRHDGRQRLLIQHTVGGQHEDHVDGGHAVPRRLVRHVQRALDDGHLVCGWRMGHTHAQAHAGKAEWGDAAEAGTSVLRAALSPARCRRLPETRVGPAVVAAQGAASCQPAGTRSSSLWKQPWRACPLAGGWPHLPTAGPQTPGPLGECPPEPLIPRACARQAGRMPVLIA